MATSLQTTSSNTFSLMRKFYSNFTGIYFYGSNWQQSSIGSDNGLVPNRQQAIIWTNDGLVHWCKYALLSLNEIPDELIKVGQCNNYSNMRQPYSHCNLTEFRCCIYVLGALTHEFDTTLSPEVMLTISISALQNTYEWNFLGNKNIILTFKESMRKKNLRQNCY